MPDAHLNIWGKPPNVDGEAKVVEASVVVQRDSMATKSICATFSSLSALASVDNELSVNWLDGKAL